MVGFAPEGGYRNANLQPGDILPLNSLAVILSADNQIINPTQPVLRLGSNDTTAANRTFGLAQGAYDGQLLYISFITGSSTTAQLLASAGNVLLQADWEPLQNDILLLIFDGNPNVLKWKEIARSDSGSVASLASDVATLETDVGTLQTDVGTLQTDVDALELDQPYDAGTPADWATAAPLSTKEALDRIAAAVEGLLTNPIP